jgi:hypothetical protein
METAQEQQRFQQSDLHHTEDREVIETDNKYQRVKREAALLRWAMQSALESNRQTNIRIEAVRLRRIEGRLSRKGQR